MKRIYYILLIAALIVGCRHKEDPVTHPSKGEYIEFDASSTDWPALSKAIINGASDLVGDGFVAWSSITPLGGNSFRSVFGSDGVYVSYPDWDYGTPKRWEYGNYVFAAALPASKLSSYDAVFDPENNKLSFDFGTNGLTLGGQAMPQANQTDIMVACDYVSNIDGEAEYVQLDFKHQLSMLNVKAKADPNVENMTVKVKTLKLYGNQPKATGVEFTFDPEEKAVSAEWTLTGSTSSFLPFMSFAADANNTAKDWSVGTEAEFLAEGVLVFPKENVSANLLVQYDVEINGLPMTGFERTVKLSGTWRPDTRYTLEMTVSVDKLILSAVTVAPWSGGSINHDFQ